MWVSTSRTCRTSCGYAAGSSKAARLAGSSAIVVPGHAAGDLVEVVELAAVDGPEERPHGNAEQNETERNQDEQDIHAGALASRRAFRTTSNELADMPMAASHGGTQSRAARGIATPLYKS